jgi:hypothetical protein
MKEFIDPAEHKQEIREAIEARRWEFSDKSWTSWFGTVEHGDFFSVEQVVNDLDLELSRVARHPPRTQTEPEPMPENTSRPGLDPPSWWAKHTEEELAKYTPAQEMVRAALGLDRPTSLDEQDDVIIGHLREQRRGPHDGETVLEFGRIFDRIRRGLERVKVFDGSSVGTGSYGSYTTGASPVGMRFQPLFLLANEAERISRETGCEPFQAVDFLLSGVPFPLTWIDIESRRQSGVITLRIGTPIVRVQDVARAYSRALSWLNTEQPSVIESAPKRRRRQRDKTIELISFVAERAPENRTIQRWEQLQDEWNRTRRKAWEFETPEGMRESHRRAAKLAARD